MNNIVFACKTSPQIRGKTVCVHWNTPPELFSHETREPLFANLPVTINNLGYSFVNHLTHVS